MTPLTMIRIVSSFVDDDGVALEHSTWAVGNSKNSALRAFERKCPLMATGLKSVTVVTPTIAPVQRLSQPRMSRLVRLPVERPV